MQLPVRLSDKDYISDKNFLYYLKLQPQFNDPKYLINYGDIEGVSQIGVYGKPPQYSYVEFYDSITLGKSLEGLTVSNS